MQLKEGIEEGREETKAERLKGRKEGDMGRHKEGRMKESLGTQLKVFSGTG